MTQPRKITANFAPQYITAESREDSIRKIFEIRFTDARRLREHEMLCETMTITPEFARFILDNYNHGNRPLRPARVAFWEDVIKSGRFMLVSQGISFSREGILNNGQHRLQGCINTGRPIRVIVAFGESREAFAVLDSGAGRTGADTLQHEGILNYSSCAAIARLYVMLTSGASTSRAIGNDKILEVVREDRENFVPAASDANHIAGKLKTSTAGIGLGLVLIRKKSRLMAVKHGYDYFVSKLALPTELPPKSQILQVRDKLANKTFRTRHLNATSAGIVEGAAIINAWNGHILNKRIPLDWKFGRPFPEAS